MAENTTKSREALYVSLSIDDQMAKGYELIKSEINEIMKQMKIPQTLAPVIPMNNVAVGNKRKVSAMAKA